MKKLLFFLLIPFLSFGQTKISNLTANPSITGAEVFPLAKSGANYKESFSNLRTWVLASDVDAPDSLVQTIAVNGWLSDSRIPQTFTNSLTTAITLIDSGWITVYPGFYTPSAALTKANIDWYFHDGARVSTIGTSMTSPLFNLDNFTVDFHLNGFGEFDLRGTLLQRLGGSTAINVFAEFKYAKSTMDTLINFRYLSNKMNQVVIDGSIMRSDTLITLFFSYDQAGPLRVQFDSIYAAQKEGIMFSLLADAMDFHTNWNTITIEGGVLKSGSATNYAFHMNYVGNGGLGDPGTGQPIFGKAIYYNVNQTRGTKAMNVTNIGYEYAFSSFGSVAGDANFDFVNTSGEALLHSDFVSITSGVNNTLTLKGFKIVLSGFIYQMTMSQQASSPLILSGIIRKSTLNCVDKVDIYGDVTQSAINANSGSDVVIYARVYDASGLNIATGGKAELKGSIIAASAVNYPVAISGGTFILTNGYIQSTGSSGSFPAGVNVTDNAIFIHNGGVIVGPTGGSSIVVANTKTLTIRNYLSYYAKLARSGAGTFTETITGGGTEVVDADVQ